MGAERDLNLIGENTKEWDPSIKVAEPIKTSEIPGFVEWIAWNPFDLEGYPLHGHEGFDFAAYLNDKGKVVLGLPKNLPIYAIADGVVSLVSEPQDEDGYYSILRLEHGARFGERAEAGLLSDYTHVVAAGGIQKGKSVKKGNLVGYLYGDPGDDLGKLVHLHLGLYNRAPYLSGDMTARLINPEIMFPNVAQKYRAIPAGKYNFQVPGLQETKVVKANFRRLVLEEGIR